MTATATIPEAIKATHQDRPVVKVQLPFRVEGGKFPVIHYDQSIIDGAGCSRCVPMTIDVNGTVLAQKIIEMMTMYHETASRVDGLLAAVDKLTTDNVLLAREVEKLTNQLAEAKRTNGKSK